MQEVAPSGRASFNQDLAHGMARDTAVRRVGGALFLVTACATAGAQPSDAVSKLKREGHVACEPALPYFCANMHVSCAGRTSVPTFPFTLRVTPAGGALDAPPGAEAFVEQYAEGRVEWSEGPSVVVRPARSNGYIRLHQDGKYVFRHYPQHVGVMSLGTCT